MVILHNMVIIVALFRVLVISEIEFSIWSQVERVPLEIGIRTKSHKITAQVPSPFRWSKNGAVSEYPLDEILAPTIGPVVFPFGRVVPRGIPAFSNLAGGQSQDRILGIVEILPPELAYVGL